MPLAGRVKELKSSSTLAITALANKLLSEGVDVVSFGAGEPDFDTPDYIKQAAIHAIESGFTKYTPSTGTSELKEAIRKKFKTDNNLEYRPEQIIVSSGAKHCLFNIIMAMIEEGDEVIIPVPYWVSYPEMVRVAGGECRFVETETGNNLKLSARALRQSLSARTKLLILNSPANPTGSVYSRKELEEIAEICRDNKIYCVSDEIYEKLIYDGASHISIASLNSEIRDLTFTVNGVSKSHAMTGWRIGYCAVPSLEIADAIKNLQDHSTSNPCSISQKAAFEALRASGEWTMTMRDEFSRRRDYLLALMNEIPSLSYVKPQGAFYLFCDISQTGLASRDFAMRLLNEEKVAVIPGDGFGRDNYIRLSFTMRPETIKKGIDRLKKWVRQLPKRS
jgi:aspartate aminotransferase